MGELWHSGEDWDYYTTAQPHASSRRLHLPHQVEAPVPGRSVTQTHLFARSRPDLAAPDSQPIHFSVPMYEPWMSGPEHGFSLMAGMIAPRSRGSITLSGAGPHDEPRIDLGALTEPDDLASLTSLIAQCREIAAADALRDYVRRTAITYHHQVGTCKMGVDEMSVVDTKLTVHGVGGMHVADDHSAPVDVVQHDRSRSRFWLDIDVSSDGT